MSLTPQQQKRVDSINCSYFCAVMIPHAPREKLKLVFDWGNWVSSEKRGKNSTVSVQLLTRTKQVFPFDDSMSNNHWLGVNRSLTDDILNQCSTKES